MIRLGPGGPYQGQMPLVQRAHGGDQRNRAATAQSIGGSPQVIERVDGKQHSSPERKAMESKGAERPVPFRPSRGKIADVSVRWVPRQPHPSAGRLAGSPDRYRH